uniref:Putative tail protein n=1 Tax=viral metagenome TaxID=1070528 RepID=A0A6M3L5E0_9ZZZZ
MAKKAEVDFSVKTDKAQKNITGFTKSMLGIGSAALAVSLAMRKIIGESAKFQAQMAQVSTMLNKETMPYMAQFTKGIRSMQMQFGQSSETLSKGLYDILSASIDASKALDVLDVSSRAAVAGITDTGIAADAITSILNAYGLQAEYATQVSDELFNIVLRGKTTFAELAGSIGNVAPTAAIAGVSFEELGGAIATITRQGIATAEAVTAVNQMIMTFLKPTTEAIEVAEKFGFELNTTTLRTIGLAGVMDRLKKASAEETSMIFGNVRALKGFNAALADAKGFMYDVDEAMKKSGSMMEAYVKQTDTLTFKWNQFKESINVTAGLIGDLLLPSLTSAMNMANNFLAALTKSLSTWGKVIDLLKSGKFGEALNVAMTSKYQPGELPLPEAPRLPEIRRAGAGFKPAGLGFRAPEIIGKPKPGKHIYRAPELEYTHFFSAFQYGMSNMFTNILTAQGSFSDSMSSMWHNLLHTIMLELSGMLTQSIFKKVGSSLLGGLLSFIPGAGFLGGLMGGIAGGGGIPQLAMAVQHPSVAQGIQQGLNRINRFS